MFLIRSPFFYRDCETVFKQRGTCISVASHLTTMKYPSNLWKFHATPWSLLYLMARIKLQHLPIKFIQLPTIEQQTIKLYQKLHTNFLNLTFSAFKNVNLLSYLHSNHDNMIGSLDFIFNLHSFGRDTTNLIFPLIESMSTFSIYDLIKIN